MKYIKAKYESKEVYMVASGDIPCGNGHTFLHPDPDGLIICGDTCDRQHRITVHMSLVGKIQMVADRRNPAHCTVCLRPYSDEHVDRQSYWRRRP